MRTRRRDIAAGLEPYRRVLAVPGFSSVIPLGLFAKLPVTAIPLTLTLHVVLGLGHGYAEAGLVTAGWVAGVGVGSAAQGRFIDRHGLRPLLGMSLLAQGAFWGAAPFMSFPVFAAGAAVSGLLLVPGSTVVRLAIASLVPEDRRHTAFALDSIITELAYMTGPVLAVLVATQVSTTAALVSMGAMLTVSTAALILRNPPSAPADAPRGAEASAGDRRIRRPQLIAVLACTVAAASVVAGYEVSVIGTLRSVGEVEQTGLVLLACGIYSLVGGLLFGALKRPVSPAAVVALLGLATLPLGFAGGWLVLALCIAPAAALCAPAAAATADAASKLGGAGATTMGLYTAALTAGSALGAPIAGAALDMGGPQAGFAVAGCLGLALAAATWPQLRTRGARDSSVVASPSSQTLAPERNDMSQPVVAIVDSYAPTALLAEEFRRAGASLVRVQSTARVPHVYEGGLDLDGYLDNIVHDGDLDATLAAVARHRPRAVVAGGEVGVELADALSAGLGLPSNGVELSAARRDKYVMTETVRAAGVPAARQILVESEDQLVEWHRSVGDRIVLKPIRSAAGDSVAFCDTPEEAASAYHRILARTNVFSVPNTGVVAMEYLRGTEYMVNTVSRDGRHHVTDIWLTTRISVNGVLDLGDTAYLLPRRGSDQDRLAAYAERVLDAVGIRHGPAHVEVKLTAAGPMLVEVGARICGGSLPYYAKVALGESQLDWTVDAFLDPARFLARSGADYPNGPAFASVTLISPVDGVLSRYRHLEALQALESFHDMRMVVRPGQPITRTVDDTGYPLLITLMHDAEETVRRDAGTIRYFDGEAFYELAGEAA